jgi:hypothetical protein
MSILIALSRVFTNYFKEITNRTKQGGLFLHPIHERSEATPAASPNWLRPMLDSIRRRTKPKPGSWA